MKKKPSKKAAAEGKKLTAPSSDQPAPWGKDVQVEDPNDVSHLLAKADKSGTQVTKKVAKAAAAPAKASASPAASTSKKVEAKDEKGAGATATAEVKIVHEQAKPQSETSQRIDEIVTGPAKALAAQREWEAAQELRKKKAASAEKAQAAKAATTPVAPASAAAAPAPATDTTTATAPPKATATVPPVSKGEWMLWIKICIGVLVAILVILYLFPKKSKKPETAPANITMTNPTNVPNISELRKQYTPLSTNVAPSVSDTSSTNTPVATNTTKVVTKSVEPTELEQLARVVAMMSSNTLSNVGNSNSGTLVIGGNIITYNYPSNSIPSNIPPKATAPGECVYPSGWTPTESKFAPNCTTEIKVVVKPGEVLEIKCTDPRWELDFPMDSSYEAQFGDNNGFSTNPTPPAKGNGFWRILIKPTQGRTVTIVINSHYK